MKYPKPVLLARTNRPLRIAVVYSRTPLPMRRADQMTVAHLLGFLKARGHDVDLYCINAGGRADAEELNWMRETCRHVKLYEHGVIPIACGLLKVPLRLVPVQVGLFSHPEQAADIRRQVEAGSYDIVYTYYVRSAEAVAGLGRASGSAESVGDRRPATFLALQLSQTLNTRRIADNAPNVFYKLFYKFESRLMARYEARIWREYTRTVLIGQKDYETISDTCRKASLPIINNHVFVAHGTDISRIERNRAVTEKPNHLVFTGVMRTPTNIQAVQWFAANVWPLILAKYPDAKWSIVGREPSIEVQRLGTLPGVVVTGTVDDPSRYVAEATVCINPMQAGGGMQNKLIEYLAGEKAVVATSVANEGIGARNGEHLLIADTPEDFSVAILKLLADSSLRACLGRVARQYVIDHWTWEAHFLKLESEFYRALNLPVEHCTGAGQG